MPLWKRRKEAIRERERGKQRDRERETEKERARARKRERERESLRELERKRETGKERESERERALPILRLLCASWQRTKSGNETDGEKERGIEKKEIKRERKRERERERERRRGTPLCLLRDAFVSFKGRENAVIRECTRERDSEHMPERRVDQLRERVGVCVTGGRGGVSDVCTFAHVRAHTHTYTHLHTHTHTHTHTHIYTHTHTYLPTYNSYGWRWQSHGV